MRRIFTVLAVGLALTATGNRAIAQQEPGETAKGMVGSWELSTADRDKTCTVTFKIAPAGAAYALAFDKACAAAFPSIRDVKAWSIGKNDVLLLVDAAGKTVLEMLEVEAGIYEGLRPNEERYFLQNAAVAAATRDRTPDQMFGDWSFVRGPGGGKPVCSLTLDNTAADADSFALKMKPGCDPLINRFGPVSWRMDRGLLIVLSAKGNTWRFEESDPTTWRRIPEAGQPLHLVKQ